MIGAAINLAETDEPLLIADGLTKSYGRQVACRDVSLTLYEGEVVAIVGESGSGKSTLLQLLAMQLSLDSGSVRYRMRDGITRDLAALGEAELRFLARTDWGFVHQDPAMGLRMAVSGGANIGERLMAVGWRHYGRIRGTATNWLERVEIDRARIDHTPRTYSGGMRQRLQIARNLVTGPRLVLMDEPTGGLDVSVQARLLDLLRGLVADYALSVVVVTHDLAVARLLSHRIMVMKDGEVIETGLTDQVLDDLGAVHAAPGRVDPPAMRRHEAAMSLALELSGVAKSFTMHLQGGVRLSVIAGVTFSVQAGECVVLVGPSGTGKSSILQMIFGGYRCDRGQILIHHGTAPTDVAKAERRRILSLSKHSIGYVSQFLRAVPRVPTIDVVAEPLVVNGMSRDAARRKATEMLKRLNIPGQLWGLPPATFSGGEQQRVNIARGFLPDLPILLLDEPTASLDAANSAVVMDLIAEKKRRGPPVVAVVHDHAVRERTSHPVVQVAHFANVASTHNENRIHGIRPGQRPTRPGGSGGPIWMARRCRRQDRRARRR